MDKYTEYLEKLISDTLLPIYMEHYRLRGVPAPIQSINSRLIEAMGFKRQTPYLLQKQNYG